MTVRSMLRTTLKPCRSVLSQILRATTRSTTTSRSVVTARVPAAAQRPLLGLAVGWSDSELAYE